MERSAKVRVRRVPAVGIAGLVATLAILPADLAANEPAPAGSEFQVNSYTTDQQRRASVAADANGDFVVLWDSQGSDGTDNVAQSIQGQRYLSDGTLQGAQFQVNTFTTNTQTNPSVSSDAAGNFVVVWDSFGPDGSTWAIQGQRYASDGTPQGGEFQVNSYTPDSQRFPSVSSDTDGDFVVVWRSDGSPGTDSDFSVMGRRFASDGTPQGGDFQVNTYTTDAQEYPSVSSDADGDFVVVWQSFEQDGSGFSIQGQRYASDGTPQGGEFQVNSYTTSDQAHPSVASDADGNFVVVWQSFGADGSLTSIQGQRYASDGTPQGGEFQINSYTTGDQLRPSVSSEADGDFVAVWHSDGADGSSHGVRGRRYTSDGTPQGGEFQVNSYTTDSQERPSVSSAANGDFVVAWESDGSSGTDSSFYSIQGQRFSVGPCIASHGDCVLLGDDTVMGTVAYEVCDTITIGPNYHVAGPSGDLTLRAGESVILGEGTSVGIDGRLTIEIDPSL